MKPKPFASLNHFTVPVAISTVLRGVVAPLVDPTSRGRVLRASASVPRHGVAEMPLDRAQLVPFLGHGEARRLPGRLGTRGAADAVDVILRRVRKVEVHDVRDLRHVDAACGDVRRHQDAIAAGTKAVEGLATLRHRAVGVQPGYAMPGRGHRAGESIRSMLGAGEYQRLTALLTEELQQQRHLPIAV